MGAKRALIVDDSKSARLFLARALEKYDIDVDNAESAEAAIEYLSHNHPDVIFMDHLMPGMDGLQAVRAIKNDPRTATIPVMMYTSQEGELFLGQARALGAVGVLPKQIRPTDVSKVLNQLHLVSERRIVEQPSFTPVDAPAEAAAEESPVPVPSRPLTDSALREHFAELRRALVTAVDTQTDRISADMRALLAEMRALLKSLPPPEAVPPPPRPASSAWAWLVACAALTIAPVSSALAWRTVRLLEGLTIELTQLRSQSASLAPAFAPAGAGAGAPAAATAGGAVSSSGPRRGQVCRATAGRCWCRCPSAPPRSVARDSRRSASSPTGSRGRRWRGPGTSGALRDASVSSAAPSTDTRWRRRRRPSRSATSSAILRTRRSRAHSARRSRSPT